MVSSTNFAALKHGVTIDTSGSSSADIAGVDAARDADVRGAFYNRPAIGKNGQFVWIQQDAQRKLIGAHWSDRAELAREAAQVHRTGPLMNLNRIPPAQADRRAPFSIEKRELTLCAARA